MLKSRCLDSFMFGTEFSIEPAKLCHMRCFSSCKSGKQCFESMQVSAAEAQLAMHSRSVIQKDIWELQAAGDGKTEKCV